MKADFRISQRSNISSKLSATASRMSRAHEHVVHEKRHRVSSHENLNNYFPAGLLRNMAADPPSQSHYVRARIISH